MLLTVHFSASAVGDKLTSGISWGASWDSPWGWGGIYGGEKAEVEPPFLLGCQSEISPFHQR